MHIVLVCINNFQEYILENISQLLKLNHKNIVILTNSYLFSNFQIYANESSNIQLVDVETLNNTFEYETKGRLDKYFRNGFWHLTSLRFFYIYEFMKQYEICDVIHLENDAPIYYNCDTIIDIFNKNYVYIPFDTFTRNIASIMYIPNKDIFKKILDNYDFNKNDMENFSIIKRNTGLIQNLPIFIKTENLSDEQNFISENSDIFPFIFDAAAIGQYIGGIDPRNTDLKDTRGFINETCVVNYNNYKIWFEEINGLIKPFILIDDKKIPIFNLHIHCKNLKEYI
jgi:hypothetical protein